MIRKALQSEIDEFINSCLYDENIYPYLSISKYTPAIKQEEDDWKGVVLMDDSKNTLVKISFDRTRGELEMTFSLYSRTKIGAGRGIKAIEEIVRRYKPRAINSCVHSTNEKSLKKNRHIFGKEWGVEEKIAWNSKLGAFDDLHYFRKVFQN